MNAKKSIVVFLNIFFLLLLFKINSILAYQLHETFNVRNFDAHQFSRLKTIMDIEQDHLGFLWFATTTGLYRFDGYTLKEYKQQGTSNSLPHFHTNQLLKDYQNKIWVGTTFGLAVYRNNSDDFELFVLGKKISNPVITCLYEDSQKNIWVGTRQNGIFKISRNRLKVEQFNKNETNIKISSNYIKAIREDEAKNIWFGTENGLNQYNMQSGVISQYLKKPNQKNSRYSILSLNNSEILIGTENGLFSFAPGQNELKRYHINSSKIEYEHIMMLEYGPNNELMIGTSNNGLYIYMPKTGVVQNFQKNERLKNSLSSNVIRTLLFDNRKNIWIGSNSGISKISYASNLFHLYRFDNNSITCLSGNKSFAIYLDPENVLWIGVVGMGLQRVDLKNNECHLFDSIQIGEEEIKLDYILDIKSDSNGILWIANYQEGLVKLNTKNLVFGRQILIDKQKEMLLKSAFIYKIDIDKFQNIWLAMEKNVLGRLKVKSNDFHLFDTDFFNKIGKSITTAKNIQHYNNKVWFGTSYNGLLSFDIESETLNQYVRPTKDKNGIPENILAAKMDNKGILWIGTSGYGLFKFDTNTEKYTNYRTEDGLADDVIWNIEVDSNDLVWIGTNNGTSVFNQKTNRFTNFYESDGLQANEATTSGYFDPKSKTIWTGGINGINAIRTENFTNEKSLNDVVFTDVKINYKTVPISTDKNKTPLLENIDIAKRLTLNYQENNFSFTYASIDFNNAERIRYQYKLDGYDDWKETSASDRIASYTNIDPGKYVFKVRATLTDTWDGEEKSINIIILPPWWKTNTAYFIYFVSLMTSLYLLIYLRTRSLKKRSIELEEEVKSRTEELVQEKSKVEQLLSRKNEEFANVSHEFRTPLTLILGPLSQVLKTNKNCDEISRLNIVQRNGYRLLRMVDQLLNMETFRIKSITQKSPQAIGKTVQLLSDAFADLANDKNISLSLKRTLDVNFSFTPDAFEKILLNLLSNAIKYTKSGGSIAVDCERTHNNEFKLEVTDTGIGIPADKLDSVFERYSRVLDENSEQVTGAGIGLALVKELVEAHQGRIEIASELGKGTTITVYLPIIDEVSENEVKRHNTDEIVAMELMSLTNQKVESTTTSIQNSVQSSSEKPSVLVIEDNSDMRDYIANSISDEYLVLTAKDGEEGVALAIEQVPDLIISDIMMPKKDGYQTTQELRSNSATNHIPIILLTARGDRESRLKGWHEKADEYLTKPFDVEELKIRLNNLLEIRDILRKRFGEAAFELNNLSAQLLESTQGSEIADDDVESHKNQMQFQFIQQLNQILEERYTDSSVTIGEIAGVLAMSERQFFRKVKNIVDMAPTNYLRRFRLEKAKELLKQGKNTTYTGFEVGFSSQSYFSKCFKAQFGVSPNDYRKNLN